MGGGGVKNCLFWRYIIYGWPLKKKIFDFWFLIFFFRKVGVWQRLRTLGTFSRNAAQTDATKNITIPMYNSILKFWYPPPSGIGMEPHWQWIFVSQHRFPFPPKTRLTPIDGNTQLHKSHWSCSSLRNGQLIECPSPRALHVCKFRLPGDSWHFCQSKEGREDNTPL